MNTIDRPRFPERAREGKPIETVALADASARARPGAPAFDPAEYRADLADMKLSEAQETELLQILWSMMGSFARMGIEADVCGLIFEGFNEAADPASANAMLAHSTHKETPSENDGNGGAP